MDGVLSSYITDLELAAQIGVTKRTLWFWRRDRKGPAFTLVGRKVLYHKESVRRWLESREQQMPRANRHRTRQVESHV